MVTRVDVRNAGAVALVTAALLGGSLVLLQGGPPSDNAAGLARWFVAEGTAVRTAAVMWLVSMLGLGVFAVSFREAMWATVLDHPWVTILFVQGAVVCATVAIVATGGTWALAAQASAGTIDAQQAVTVWAVVQALLLFATWGLAPALVVVALALWRHSTLGQIAAGAGGILAVALLVPLDRSAVLLAFSGWLAFVGVALLLPTQPSRAAPVDLDSDVFG